MLRQLYAIWDGTQEMLCGDPHGSPEALTDDLSTMAISPYTGVVMVPLAPPRKDERGLLSDRRPTAGSLVLTNH